MGLHLDAKDPDRTAIEFFAAAFSGPAHPGKGEAALKVKTLGHIVLYVRDIERSRRFCPGRRIEDRDGNEVELYIDV